MRKPENTQEAEVSMQLWFEKVPEGLSSYRRPVLLVGHPGHELRVLGWLAENRPRVYVLTDGSGLDGTSRLPATSRLLDRLGSTRGRVFGLFSDARIYRAILDQEIGIFQSIVDELAQSLIEHGVDFIAADAAEGFNPTHDICRQLANAAVSKARMLTGRAIANFEFCLTEWDLKGKEHHDSRCWHLRLEDRLLRLKINAAREYDELKDEVEQAIALKGEEYFRVECLRKVSQSFPEYLPGSRPYYEELGEQRVATGKYRAAIRYHAHMLPILRAIRDHASLPQTGALSSGRQTKTTKAGV
jgi:hypothetical protein